MKALDARRVILLHNNYFEQGLTLEQACALAKELGADGVEFRREPVDKSCTGTAYLDRIARALDWHPLPWISFGSPGIDLMHPERSYRDAEIERAMNFFTEAVGRFPLKIVNTMTGRLQNPDPAFSAIEYQHHGSAIATEAHWERAVEGFKILGEFAASQNFRFALETHGLFLHDTLDAALALVRRINHPSVGLLWDQVNLMLFPQYPSLEDAVKLASPALHAVHLKNVLVPPSRFLAICDLDQGILNIRSQVRLLLEAGYSGPWCIECPRGGDRLRFAARDIEYLREILRNVPEDSEKAPL